MGGQVLDNQPRKVVVQVPEMFITLCRDQFGINDDQGIAEFWLLTYGPGGAWEYLVEWVDGTHIRLLTDNRAIMMDKLLVRMEKWMRDQLLGSSLFTTKTLPGSTNSS